MSYTTSGCDGCDKYQVWSSVWNKKSRWRYLRNQERYHRSAGVTIGNKSKNKFWREKNWSWNVSWIALCFSQMEYYRSCSLVKTPITKNMQKLTFLRYLRRRRRDCQATSSNFHLLWRWCQCKIYFKSVSGERRHFCKQLTLFDIIWHAVDVDDDIW